MHRQWKKLGSAGLAAICLLFYSAGCSGSQGMESRSDSSLEQPPAVSDVPQQSFAVPQFSSSSSGEHSVQSSQASAQPQSQVEASVPEESVAGEPAAEDSSSGAALQPQEQNGLRGARTNVLVPYAAGTEVYGNSSVSIDVSNSSEGYVMIQYSGSNPKVKVQITKDGGSTYTYNLNSSGYYEAFPFSGGSGGYTINVFENISGTSYAQAAGQYVTVSLRSSVLPFLYANQYVNFWSGCYTIELGAQLASTANNDLQVVENIYNYVTKNISYDYNKASSVTSGYLPNVDSTVNSGRGICFDYAAVMATMLRTQGIPTKLVVGYAGSVYHAWISTYISDIGWVNGIIYFDGQSWVRMDPTFAASGGGSSDIMSFIGDGTNYNAMYVY